MACPLDHRTGTKIVWRAASQPGNGWNKRTWKTEKEEYSGSCGEVDKWYRLIVIQKANKLNLFTRAFIYHFCFCFHFNWKQRRDAEETTREYKIKVLLKGRRRRRRWGRKELPGSSCLWKKKAGRHDETFYSYTNDGTGIGKWEPSPVLKF